MSTPEHQGCEGHSRQTETHRKSVQVDVTEVWEKHKGEEENKEKERGVKEKSLRGRL